VTSQFGFAALALLTATHLVGCMTTGRSAYRSPAEQPYFIGPGPVNLESEHLDRVACGNGGPLVCQCSASRTARSRRCSCVL
jgi:hypothetical protein